MIDFIASSRFCKPRDRSPVCTMARTVPLLATYFAFSLRSSR